MADSKEEKKKKILNNNGSKLQAPKRKRPPNFLKNVFKSVRYSVRDIRQELTPNISNTIDSFKEAKSNAYDTIKDEFKIDIKNIKDNEIIKTSKDLVKNMLSDLASGNLYNEERSLEGDKAVAAAMGFEIDEDMFNMDEDDDFDFGDMDDNDEESSSNDSFDFGDDEDSSEDVSIDNTTNNDNRQYNNQTNNFFNMESDDNNTVKALGVVTQSTIESNAAGFSAVAGTLQNIYNFHQENTLKFYNEFSEKMSTVNNVMVEMEKMMLASNKLEALREKEDKQGELISMLDNFSFNYYIDKLKENKMDDAKDLLNTGIAAFKKVASNPIGMLMTEGIKALIPQRIKNSIENFDYMVGKAPLMLNTVFEKMSKRDGIIGSLGGFLNDTFGVKFQAKSKLDLTSKNEPTVFDTYTKKAIVEVIPSYLAKILAGVTGNEELSYSYARGHFVSSSDLRKNYKEEHAKTILNTNEISSTLNNVKNDYIAGNEKHSEDERVKISDSLNKLILNMSMSDSSALAEVLNGKDNYELLRKRYSNGTKEMDYAIQYLINYLNSATPRERMEFEVGMATGKKNANDFNERYLKGDPGLLTAFNGVDITDRIIDSKRKTKEEELEEKKKELREKQKKYFNDVLYGSPDEYEERAEQAKNDKDMADKWYKKIFPSLKFAGNKVMKFFAKGRKFVDDGIGAGFETLVNSTMNAGINSVYTDLPIGAILKIFGAENKGSFEKIKEFLKNKNINLDESLADLSQEKLEVISKMFNKYFPNSEVKIDEKSKLGNAYDDAFDKQYGEEYNKHNQNKLQSSVNVLNYIKEQEQGLGIRVFINGFNEEYFKTHDFEVVSTLGGKNKSIKLGGEDNELINKYRSFKDNLKYNSENGSSEADDFIYFYENFKTLSPEEYLNLSDKDKIIYKELLKEFRHGKTKYEEYKKQKNFSQEKMLSYDKSVENLDEVISRRNNIMQSFINENNSILPQNNSTLGPRRFNKENQSIELKGKAIENIRNNNNINTVPNLLGLTIEEILNDENLDDTEKAKLIKYKIDNDNYSKNLFESRNLKKEQQNEFLRNLNGYKIIKDNPENKIAEISINGKIIRIPSLKKGTENTEIDKDQQLVLVHKGEQILTAEQAEEYRKSFSQINYNSNNNNEINSENNQNENNEFDYKNNLTMGIGLINDKLDFLSQIFTMVTVMRNEMLSYWNGVIPNGKQELKLINVGTTNNKNSVKVKDSFFKRLFRKRSENNAENKNDDKNNDKNLKTNLKSIERDLNKALKQGIDSINLDDLKNLDKKELLNKITNIVGNISLPKRKKGIFSSLKEKLAIRKSKRDKKKQSKLDAREEKKKQRDKKRQNRKDARAQKKALKQASKILKNSKLDSDGPIKFSEYDEDKNNIHYKDISEITGTRDMNDETIFRSIKPFYDKNIVSYNLPENEDYDEMATNILGLDYSKRKGIQITERKNSKNKNSKIEDKKEKKKSWFSRIKDKWNDRKNKNNDNIKIKDSLNNFIENNKVIGKVKNSKLGKFFAENFVKDDDSFLGKVKNKIFGSKQVKIDLSHVPKGVTPVWIIGGDKKKYNKKEDNKDESKVEDDKKDTKEEENNINENKNKKKSWFTRMKENRIEKSKAKKENKVLSNASKLRSSLKNKDGKIDKEKVKELKEERKRKEANNKAEDKHNKKRRKLQLINDGKLFGISLKELLSREKAKTLLELAFTKSKGVIGNLFSGIGGLIKLVGHGIAGGIKIIGSIPYVGPLLAIGGAVAGGLALTSLIMKLVKGASGYDYNSENFQGELPSVDVGSVMSSASGGSNGSSGISNAASTKLRELEKEQAKEESKKDNETSKIVGNINKGPITKMNNLLKEQNKLQTKNNEQMKNMNEITNKINKGVMKLNGEEEEEPEGSYEDLGDSAFESGSTIMENDNGNDMNDESSVVSYGGSDNIPSKSTSTANKSPSSNINSNKNKSNLGNNNQPKSTVVNSNNKNQPNKSNVVNSGTNNNSGNGLGNNLGINSNDGTNNPNDNTSQSVPTKKDDTANLDKYIDLKEIILNFEKLNAISEKSLNVLIKISEMIEKMKGNTTNVTNITDDRFNLNHPLLEGFLRGS